MCGISGILARRDHPGAEEFVAHAIRLQRPRGPDHEAASRSDFGGWTAVLGHNRLCVIDLEPTGHQPMWSGDGRLVASYNGEIYNFLELRAELESTGVVFRSRSDTEVLLAAWSRWGEEALQRCNGMFAVAMLDLARGELVLARDRFGVKPLYYTHQPGQLCFASTLGPLLGSGPQPDLEYLKQGLEQGAYEDQTGRSPYQGILSVPPGHLVRIRLEADRVRPELRQWYRFEEETAAAVERLASVSTTAAVTEVREILSSAVSLRLRSDVPVGVSLSGGLDSATVAVLAAVERGSVRGLTFGHPDAPETEALLVAELARDHRIVPEYVWPSPDRMAELFWSCLRAQQAPFASGSVVAQHAVFQRARELGLTVMLGGQGGDEAFMGYRKFQLFRLQAALASRQPGELLQAAVGFGKALWGERHQAGVYWARGRQYATGVGPESVLRLGEVGSTELGLGGAGGIRGRQVRDILHFSLPTLLRYEDRNSMAHSIESRLPFLDYRVLVLGVALPEALKLRGGWGKWIVRKAFQDRLPASIAWARAKRGFDVNAHGWITAGLGAAVREALQQTVPRLGDLVMPGLRVSDYFANTRLANDRAVFGDAVALLWLGGWASAREG